MTDKILTDRVERKFTGWRKVWHLVQEDTSGIHPRLIALNLVAGLLPTHRAPLSRARLFALAGFRIGVGTRIAEPPRINGDKDLFAHLIIGRDCRIEAGCVFDLAEQITIGDRVTIGPGVMLLTSTHELDIAEHRAGLTQLMPVTVGDGVWIGARAVILPGVTVGAGAIVEAGAVVNKDVAAQTRVGGIPAGPIEAAKPSGNPPA
jgi:acetyltransferase-like isoleucine patch superfamily enzyme